MADRFSVGRFFLIFCCVAALAWASCELIYSQSDTVDMSNDASMMNVRVGAFGWHRCNVVNNCPSACVRGSNTGYIANFPGADPRIVAHWTITGFVKGTMGCSDNTTYKTCGSYWCILWCNNAAKDKCGSVVLPTESVRVGGAVPVMSHHCSTTTSVCQQGCG